MIARSTTPAVRLGGDLVVSLTASEAIADPLLTSAPLLTFKFDKAGNTFIWTTP